MAKYIEVCNSKNDEVYYIKKLNVLKKRVALQKAISLVSPLLGESIDSYKKYEQDQVVAAFATDADKPEEYQEPNFDLFGIFAVLSNQIDNPQIVEMQDLLLEGSKLSKKGKVSDIESLPAYDLEDADDMGVYLKVLMVSFKENVYTPFLQCLNDMGYSEIVGSVQAVLQKQMMALTPKNSKTSSEDTPQT